MGKGRLSGNTVFARVRAANAPGKCHKTHVPW